jgi:hypothetical protein
MPSARRVHFFTIRATHSPFRKGGVHTISSGASAYFDKIGADTIQRVNGEYAQKRRSAKRLRLRWRNSGGPRRSLGWVPLKAASLKRCGRAVRFGGKTFRVFESERLEGITWRQGCFAQDGLDPL